MEVISEFNEENQAQSLPPSTMDLSTELNQEQSLPSSTIDLSMELAPPSSPHLDSEITVASSDGPGLPNSGNGFDFDNYSWVQTLDDVKITIPVPEETVPGDVTINVKKNHIKVGLKGQPLIIDGGFFLSVKKKDTFWYVEDGRSISILLTKREQNWWECLLKVEPEINTEKAEPEAEDDGSSDDSSDYWFSDESSD